MSQSPTPAHQAFEAFAQGWKSGNFQPFLDMLADEVMFWYPYGKYRGKFDGREGKGRLVAKCLEHSKVGDRLTFQPPHHITQSDTTVMFEFECEGTIENEFYHGRIAIALDFQDDQITGLREYFGDVDG